MKSEAAHQQTRKFPRFTANPNALVLLHDKMGTLPHHIINIGQGGLSFRYHGKKLNLSEISRISLYHENQLVVGSIPVKPVSDHRLRKNFEPVRCGSVSFEKLDDEQKIKLDDYIRNVSRPFAAAL